MTQWFKLLYNENVIRDGNDSLSEINDDIEPETIYWLPKDEIIDSLKFERDFYFSKLHELELIITRINLHPTLKGACEKIKSAKYLQNEQNYATFLVESELYILWPIKNFPYQILTNQKLSV